MSKKDKKTEKLEPLEEGLLLAMRAIDKQIAREMQRSPAELEISGVQKWEPIQKRIELVTSILLGFIGSNKRQLDSLLVLSQASTKALRMFVDELGQENIGEIRSAYLEKAFENISRDAREGDASLKPERTIN